MIVGVAPRGGGSEFFGGGALARANEDSVLAQILQEIFSDIARGNREWKAAIITEIEGVAARGDRDERIRLALRAGECDRRRGCAKCASPGRRWRRSRRWRMRRHSSGFRRGCRADRGANLRQNREERMPEWLCWDVVRCWVSRGYPL